MPCARHTQQQDHETGFAPGAHCRSDGTSRLVGGYASRRARDPRGLADSMARCTRCRAHGTLSSKTTKRAQPQYRGPAGSWAHCRSDGTSRQVGGQASSQAQDPRGLADSMARCPRCRTHGTLSSKTRKRAQPQYRGPADSMARCARCRAHGTLSSKTTKRASLPGLTAGQTVGVGKWTATRRAKLRGLADSMARCARCRAHGILSSEPPKQASLPGLTAGHTVGVG